MTMKTILLPREESEGRGARVEPPWLPARGFGRAM